MVTFVFGWKVKRCSQNKFLILMFLSNAAMGFMFRISPIATLRIILEFICQSQSPVQEACILPADLCRRLTGAARNIYI